MKKFLITSASLVLLLSACGSSDEVDDEMNFLDPIEVELTMETEVAVKEEMVTYALVTQNNQPVLDASEVVFEIWQHGVADTYRLVEGKNIGDGIYEVSWQAVNEGVYYIYYHVTARGMHRMEKHQFVVGDVDVEAILATPDEPQKKHMH